MWNPISKAELTNLLKEEKAYLDEKELTFFEKIEVPLETAKIQRQGKIEKVFVVARFNNKIVFYEDVEEGFEISEIDGTGVIKEYGANQYELRHIVNQLLNKYT